MCLVSQCRIGYVALEGLTEVLRKCLVRPSNVDYVA